MATAFQLPSRAAFQCGSDCSQSQITTLRALVTVVVVAALGGCCNWIFFPSISVSVLRAARQLKLKYNFQADRFNYCK